MDIRTLIAEKRLLSAFEPVVSVKQRAILGVKAIASSDAKGFADADALHEAATREGLSVELDRAFRRNALEAFKALSPAPSFLLFLGFDTAIIDQGVVGSGHLLAQVREAGLTPQNIVIEISESGARDVDALKKFIQMYRDHGFLIALSDVGAGHSNLGRVALARPDILKIGGSLVGGIDRDPTKQEIFKALMTLSHKIGALVVAADVEREKEALTTLEMGVDMVGGSYWGAFEAGKTSALEEKIVQTASTFKAYSVEKTKAAAARGRDQDRMMGGLLKDLAALTPDRFDEKLAALAQANADLECLFILDGAGLQATDTAWNPHRPAKPNGLFRPARKGADHSLKDYFYLLQDAFVSRYRTEPYISQASGNLCVTLSGLFRDAGNDNYILCVDVPIS